MNQEKKAPQMGQVLPDLGLEAMLEAGVHFGHQSAKRHPMMGQYIWTVRSGVSIVDLAKTREALAESLLFVARTVKNGKKVLFVGTKKQTKGVVVEAAEACEMPYVVDRWIGGTFTNFPVIRARAVYLRDGRIAEKKGDFAKYTKYEQVKKKEELDRLTKKMGGIVSMEELPGAIIVTGVKEDRHAIHEAAQKKIPVVAIVDTNMDPRMCDFVVPGNDDAISSLRFFLNAFAFAAKNPDELIAAFGTKEEEKKEENKSKKIEKKEE